MSRTDVWFYLSELAGPGKRAVLDAREARHAAGSRRLTAGDELTLFDGRGTIAQARIVGMRGSKHVEVEIIRYDRCEPPSRELRLAAALPKGDRQGVILSMAAQLGIACFTPLMCERSVAKAGESFRERAERIVVEACKQSRQPFVPRIEPAAEPADFAARYAEQAAVLLAHPSGESIAARISGIAAAHIAVMVGPEGGFTEREVAEAVGNGALPVSLGDSILRIETAAVAMLAYLRLSVGGAKPQA